MSEAQDKLQLQVEEQLRAPKSSVGGYELPCGYLLDGTLHTSVVVREITGTEEDIMSSGSLPGAQKVTKVLANCLESVGPITGGMHQVVLDLTVGDRVYLMFAIRRATLGDEFPFTSFCPSCDKEGLYSEDLSTLKVKAMPNPSQRIYDFNLPKSGMPVRFRVMTGADEEKLTKMKNTTDEQSLALLIRTELLNGKPPTLGDIKKLGMADRNFMRDQMNDNEGSLDTEIEITCEHCSHEYKQPLDIRQEGFFFPNQVQKRWNRKSST